MDLNLNDYKTYKHLAQPIYNILVKNNIKFTITNTHLLCNYSTLDEKTKNEINKLFTNNNDNNNIDTIIC
jgi:hypothetical protein